MIMIMIMIMIIMIIIMMMMMMMMMIIIIIDPEIRTETNNLYKLSQLECQLARCNPVLLTSVTEELNSGLPRTNSASGQGET